MKKQSIDDEWSKFISFGNNNENSESEDYEEEEQSEWDN